MPDEKVLKPAAAVSVILMLIIVAVSFSMKESNKLAGVTGTAVFLMGEESEVAEEKAQEGVFAIFPGEKSKEVLAKLRDKTIVIQKPKSVSEVTTVAFEEIAIEQKIILHIEGIHTGELSEDSIYRVNGEEIYYGSAAAMEGDMVQFLTIAEEKKLDEEYARAHITITLDTNYAYELYEDDGYYYISLLRAKDRYEKIIVVDAGHGGNDPGTFPSSEQCYEKDVNLAIVKHLLEYLKQDDTIKVYTTRTEDVLPTLKQRAALANNLEADLFLSVHCNSNANTQIQGMEVLYNEKQDGTSTFTSKDFAQICLEHTNGKLSLKNRGLVPRSSNVYIVGAANMPVALVEVGFMSNPSDLAVLSNEYYQKKAAEGLYEAVQDAFERLEQREEEDE